MKKAIQVTVLCKAFIKLCVTINVSLFLLFSSLSFAEDIELYVKGNVGQATSRPQVLIIFDTSNSMVWNSLSVKPSFDVRNAYGTGGEGLLYYTKGEVDSGTMPVAGNSSETRVFTESVNSCKTAQAILDKYGFYTGHVREYTFQGNSGKWTELPDVGTSSAVVIDCEDDVLGVNSDNNNFNSGYPVDGEGDAVIPVYHTGDVNDSNTKWSGKLVTLYSAKYLRWYHNSSLPNTSKTYFEIAKESVTNLLNSAPFVDFGLQVYNQNYGSSDNGGRIVEGIKESTISTRASLLTTVDDLVTIGATPLCETLYETSRYLAGKEVTFGLQQGSATPSRETTVNVEGGTPLKYKSPYKGCSNEIIIILITDGEPTLDDDANSLVRGVPETGQDPMGPAYATPFSPMESYHNSSSYLAPLAGWMNKNDINTTLDGEQTARTFTIGFGNFISAVTRNLLTETASQGGGSYYDATSATELTNRLNNILAQIAPANNTLTSASVASNNFDASQTLDSVYYAMFQPDNGPRWQGNLKKYKIKQGIQKGFNNVKAVNSNGMFDEGVQSYWSSSVDGIEVGEGGVAEMLRGQTNRTIYSDLGANGALLELTRANAIGANAFGSSSALATKLDIIDDNDTIDEYLAWAKGKDIDDVDEDNDKNENRPDVFGDPLHSKPLVINYGSKVYILVGTNQGVLHFFEDNDAANTVSEKWAFMPKSLFSNIKPLRDNYSSTDKVYGVDGPITAHIVDTNGDGVVDTADGDEVWVFFGLRRGGNSYYALNLKNPDTPTLMWTKKTDSGTFKDLGQTWSQPKVIYSSLNVTSTTAKPTLIFGGGYDTKKDSTGIGGASGEDTYGKAIYMLDAESGDFVWSLAPTGTTAFSGTDSIVSKIGTLDSDGDGLTDRLYAGDTGGNVWRVDMPGKVTSKFSVFKLASFGGDASNSEDRRFFNEPAIVRAFITETIDTGKTDSGGQAIIVKEEIPYDAILLGSGDKTNPIGKDNDDVFYMVKDSNIQTEQFTSGNVPATITINDLYNYTSDPFKGLTGTAFNDEAKKVSEKNGWHFNLQQSGEKSTAKALVINNVVYFTTYTPPDLSSSSTSCNIASGQGWLYAVDLSLGIKGYDWDPSDARTGEPRIRYINGQFLGPPTLIVTKTDDGDPATDDTDAGIIVGREKMGVDLMLKTSRTYLYIDESQ